jgi:predicted secreted protein
VVEREELEAQGVAGEPITLPIAHGPATGYGWELELPPGVEQIEDEPGEELPPDVRLGGAAGGHPRVRAPAGDHVILARLVRPWEPDHPARTVRIHLHVR